MSKDALISFYENKYADEEHATSISRVPLRAIPLNRFEAAVKFFPQHFKGGRILEIAAGNGNVAATLLRSDLRIDKYVLGDISYPRVKGLKQAIDDERVEVGLIDAENLTDDQAGKYDAIIMIALVEHLVDPLKSMQQIRKLLSPGGILYLETPNIAKYTQRLKLLAGRFPSTASQNEGLTTFSGEPVQLHEEGHLHYFTYRSLSLMLTERCGFSSVTKLAYCGGRTVFGKRIHHRLARLWPEMFSELVLIAHN